VDSRFRRKKGCPTCGKEFVVVPCHYGQKYCSKACAGIARRKEALVRVCKTCGKEFEVPPSRSEQKYCCRECYAESRRTAKYETVTCRYCGHKTRKKVWMKAIYCGKECEMADRRLKVEGE
jgi:hypothetical protein